MTNEVLQEFHARYGLRSPGMIGDRLDFNNIMRTLACPLPEKAYEDDA